MPSSHSNSAGAAGQGRRGGGGVGWRGARQAGAARRLRRREARNPITCAPLSSAGASPARSGLDQSPTTASLTGLPPSLSNLQPPLPALPPLVSSPTHTPARARPQLSVCVCSALAAPPRRRHAGRSCGRGARRRGARGEPVPGVLRAAAGRGAGVPAARACACVCGERWAPAQRKQQAHTPPSTPIIQAPTHSHAPCPCQTWLRVALGYHTWPQVAAGAVLGAASGAGWFALGAASALPALRAWGPGLPLLYGATLAGIAAFACRNVLAWAAERGERPAGAAAARPRGRGGGGHGSGGEAGSWDRISGVPGPAAG